MEMWISRCILCIAQFSHVKLDKVQKIIDHYFGRKIVDGKVINIKEYKQTMNLE